MSARSSIGRCRTHWTWYWSERGCAQCAMAAKLRDLREQLAGVMARLEDNAAEIAETQQRLDRLRQQLDELQQRLDRLQTVAHTHGPYQVQP